MLFVEFAIFNLIGQTGDFFPFIYSSRVIIFDGQEKWKQTNKQTKSYIKYLIVWNSKPAYYGYDRPENIEDFLYNINII